MNNNSSREATALGEERDEVMAATTTTTATAKRRHRCCCNLLHVTTATLLIGCFELCYFTYEVFSTIYHFVKTGEQHVFSLSISLFGIILAFIAVILLFAALKTLTPYLLVPHLLMQAAAVCVLSLICLFCIFAVTAGTSLDFRIVNVEDSPAGELALSRVGESAYELTHISKALALFLSLISIFLLVLALLQVWMLIIVLRCFFYLQEKAILKAQPAAMDTEVDRIPVSKSLHSSAQKPTQQYDTENNHCFTSQIDPTNRPARVETDC